MLVSASSTLHFDPQSFSSGRGSERGYGSERRGSEMAEDSRYKSATPQQVKVSPVGPLVRLMCTLMSCSGCGCV